MQNITRLGLLLGSLSIFPFALSGCGDEDTPDGGNGGTGGSAGGAGKGGTAGSSGSSAGTGGGNAGMGGGGTGGSSAGMGGQAGSGGGGAGGGGAGGGGGGGSGGGGGMPSAACKMWCEGANGVVMQCMANNLPADINSEAKCLAECASAPAASVTCWNQHLGFIVDGQAKGTHCPHATGGPGNGQCPEL